MQGICDYLTVFDLLNTVGYDGWVVAEEESDFARQDGISAIRKNRDYLRLLGY